MNGSAAGNRGPPAEPRPAGSGVSCSVCLPSCSGRSSPVGRSDQDRGWQAGNGSVSPGRGWGASASGRRVRPADRRTPPPPGSLCVVCVSAANIAPSCPVNSRPDLPPRYSSSAGAPDRQTRPTGSAGRSGPAGHSAPRPATKYRIVSG